MKGKARACGKTESDLDCIVEKRQRGSVEKALNCAKLNAVVPEVQSSQRTLQMQLNFERTVARSFRHDSAFRQAAHTSSQRFGCA